MKIILIISLLFFNLSVTLFCFSQGSMINENNLQKMMTDNQLFENFIQESENLRNEFTPIFEHLKEQAWVKEKYGKQSDPDRWYREYDQPLFEATKLAMKRITGTDDYLEMWEKRVPEKIWLFITAMMKEDFLATWEKIKIIPRSDILSGSNMSLLTLYSLAIIHERQTELTSGIFYRVSEDGHGLMGGMGGGTGKFVLHSMTFPPIVLSDATFDESWDVMAIYSFKNDRARNLLFDLATKSNEKYDSFADWAIYYLPFFPNSRELLPKVKILLKEEAAKEQEKNPVRAKLLLDENGELINSSLRYPDGSYPKVKGMTNYDWQRLVENIPRLLQLTRLLKELEFQEKIPMEERERFEIFRRELAISWALSCKTARPGPRASAVLRKGDEHFEIYLVEYPFPCYCTINILWEEDNNSYPNTQENPYWQKRKAFYEHELAHPRPIYTERQMEYLREQVKQIERQQK